MKKLIISAAIGLFLVSCSDNVDKWSEWPEWTVPTPVTINDLTMDEEVYQDFKSLTMDLTQGQSLTFTGIDDISYVLPPDFFSIVDKTNARFIGPDGKYLLNYDSKSKLIYIESPGAAYPDGLWFCGDNWGHPLAGYVTTWGWTWANPNSGYYFCKVADKKFQATLFLGEGFKFKFFTIREWIDGGATEITALARDGITLTNPLSISGDAMNGDFVAGPLFQAGVYTLTLDMNAHTLDAVPADGHTVEVKFKINGKTLNSLPDAPAMLGVNLDLKSGDKVLFEEMNDMTNALSPDFFCNVSAKEATFKGQEGNYNLFYDLDTKLIYVENRANPSALWVNGSGFGHPMGGVATSNWAWGDTKSVFMANKISEGVYDITLYLSQDFNVKFFWQYGWGNETGSLGAHPYPESLLSYGYAEDSMTGNITLNGDYKAGNDFTPGVYTLRLDTNRQFCGIVGKYDNSDIDNTVKIKNIELSPVTYTGYYNWGEVPNDYLGADIDFTQGEEVAVNGIARPDMTLHPDFFESRDGKIFFIGRTGRYRLSYKLNTYLTYVEPLSDVLQPYAVWITGVGLGHPRSSQHRYDISDFNWSDQINSYVLTGNGDGIYKGSIFFEPNDNDRVAEGFFFQFYPAKNSWDNIYPAHSLNIVNQNGASIGVYKGSQNFGGIDGFNAGIYEITLDTNTTPATITFSRK